MSSLLATIVASRGLPPEPVATDALVHLCASVPAAADAMTKLLVDLCPGATTAGLRFTGQDIIPDTVGRPDLVASDPSGVRIVVEAKFDATLTPAQVGEAYVGRLTPGVEGCLVFLVPRDRMRNVWRTVSVTPGGSPTPLDLPAGSEDAGIASRPLGAGGHVIAVLSWESLLNRIGALATQYGDKTGAAELAQVAGLVEWRTRVGWVPVMPDDLPQRTGRQLGSVNDTLKSVSTRLSSAKVRPGSADGGFGRHITSPSGKSIWIGTWLSWWDRYGPGPAWAQVVLASASEMALTSQALVSASIRHHTRARFNDVLIPLEIVFGGERETVEASLATQIEDLIAVVDALAVDAVEVANDPAGV